jgi:hypothetical protein
VLHFTAVTSVTLLHSEEIFTIPALQAITKCSLFQNNPTLLVSPYRVQCPVSLSTFREFLSALEGNAIKITETNIRDLQQLCEEFGFSELSAKLSEFCQRLHNSQRRQIANPLYRMRNAFLSESFEFVVNGSVIESKVSEAAALSPAVREQLSVDGCARKFLLQTAESKQQIFALFNFFFQVNPF